jgi:hypothetical protein
MPVECRVDFLQSEAIGPPMRTPALGPASLMRVPALVAEPQRDHVEAAPAPVPEPSSYALLSLSATKPQQSSGIRLRYIGREAAAALRPRAMGAGHAEDP